MIFTARTCGKWILAGEHSVLRGSPALVFPIRDRGMTFTYEKSHKPFQLKLQGERGDELQLIVFGLLEKALEKVERTREHLSGTFVIDSNLPLGAGMGGSAALCVGLSKFLAHLDFLPAYRIYSFSRSLEDLFHGESSGVDIAVALEGRGLRFLRGENGGDYVSLDVRWQPRWYLSYSGKKGVTAECVRRVKELFARDKTFAESIDHRMGDAVARAEAALRDESEERLERLAQAIETARQCFQQWGLCEGPLERHMEHLLKAGALAVKPTGSGGGGYVLSLWREEPPNSLKSELISLPIL